MSQMPETPFAGWAEQGYDPSAYPQQAEAQPAHNADAAWQQDTEPDWGASQHGYPDHDYAANDYTGNEYAGNDYPGQQYPGYPPQQAQGYPAQPEPTMVVPPQPAPEQDTGSGLPTEFDHLFRDSTPDSRRAIDRQKPMVGGAGAGYLAGSQSAAMPPPEAAAMPEQAYQQPFPQQGEQYGEPFPGPAAAAYQAPQFQSGQYPQQQPDYQQGGGYGGSGGFGGGADGDRPRNRRPLIIGGAVAVAVVIGIVIATSNGGPSGQTPTASTSGGPSAAASKTTPKQQADQIYQLIQQSSQLRSDANTAVVDVNGCKNLSNAQNTLSSTAQKRQAQADSVGRLDVSGIQNGAQLVGQLKAAWTASAQYDTAYAQIAGDVQSGCKTSTVRKDSNQQAADTAASAANSAKTQAAQLWNDNVATPLGESQVSSDKL